ncbi:MAG: excinuclease ABC subunit UvrC [Candidatus Omnitrophota bacterium]
MDIKERLRQFPKSSGVYIMQDQNGRTIYVGKAASLRNRVSSYFRHNKNQDLKTRVLVSQIKDVKFIPTDSEEQALLLEAALIKERLPKYNVIGRDNKSYPFVEITKEDFPRIYICRPRNKKGAVYFGPYIDAGLLRNAYKAIRRIFPFRSCFKLPRKPCLYYRLDLCPAPCGGLISKRDYRQTIKNISLLLKGKKEALVIRLMKRMEKFAKEKKFEEAAKLRDEIQALSIFSSNSSRFENKDVLRNLKELLQLPSLPRRIEAFDVSNISGRETTASMISFLGGLPDKDNYRRFKIKETKGIDDYASIAEVTRRRYSRLKNEKLHLPDLVIIDGGQGQLNAVSRQLSALGLDIPAIALAKANEDIYLKGQDGPIKLKKDSKILHLIQHIRNESHRFAVKYHRLLRRKKIIGR